MSIECEANRLSQMLDSGQVVNAANRLREDMQNSRPDIFRNLVRLTDQYEDKNWGGDLVIVDYPTTDRYGQEVTRRALAVRGYDNYYGRVTELICDLDQLNSRRGSDWHRRFGPDYSRECSNNFYPGQAERQRQNYYNRSNYLYGNPGISIGIPFDNRGGGININLPFRF